MEEKNVDLPIRVEKKVSIQTIISVIFGLALIAVSIAGYNVWTRLEDAQAIIRSQADGIAGVKSELQKANQALGLAESNIVARDRVIDDYDKMVKDLNIELDDIKDANRVKPISKDQIVVVIEKKIEGGKQEIITKEEGVIQYAWIDPTNRFSLVDPDIKISGNEEFSYKLRLRVTGYVLQDETGSFRARQVVAQEIYEQDGKIIEGPPVDIENNIYEYAPTIRKKTIFDMWHPRAYVLLDNKLDPGVGVELINIGHYIDYVNIGIGTFIALDTQDFPNNVPSSRLGVGLQYVFIPPLLSTNIGVGLGISSPFDAFMQKYEITGSLIFYFTN